MRIGQRRLSGRIRRLVPGKAYGFITVDHADGYEIWFHTAEMYAASPLPVGARVTFQVATDRHGRRHAADVKGEQVQQ